MTHEDYVSFEQAQKLKELGFDWESRGVYDADRPNPNEVDDKVKVATDFNACIDFVGLYSAPTLAQAQKWLREVKEVDITVIPTSPYGERKYRWALDRWNPRLKEWTDDLIDTYEQALSAGIDKALEILKQK